MKDLDTAELARLTGLPASTLRYYEEKGLIVSIGRRGLKRLFDPSVVDRLSLIALGRAAGFSLDEIGQSRQGRPILLITVGERIGGADPAQKPAVWLDGGTHANNVCVLFPASPDSNARLSQAKESTVELSLY